MKTVTVELNLFPLKWNDKGNKIHVTIGSMADVDQRVTRIMGYMRSHYRQYRKAGIEPMKARYCTLGYIAQFYDIGIGRDKAMLKVGE